MRKESGYIMCMCVCLPSCFCLSTARDASEHDPALLGETVNLLADYRIWRHDSRGNKKRDVRVLYGRNLY